MRELIVYYCKKCGRYGFYQVARNAVCPVCQIPMSIFPMSYQYFMDLDYTLRDQLISEQIAGIPAAAPSVVQRITEEDRKNNSRGDVAGMKAQYDALVLENRQLHQKNAELEETIVWMHDMIWDLTLKLREAPRP